MTYGYFVNGQCEISVMSVYYKVSLKGTELVSEKEENLRTRTALHKEAINLTSHRPRTKFVTRSTQIGLT